MYLCANCQTKYPKWAGKCENCGSWGSLNQLKETIGKSAQDITPIRLCQISQEQTIKTPTGLEELDNIFNGGLSQGALLLLGGEPGVGKSTLALQIATAFLTGNNSVYYVSGEESPQQIKQRADRLQIKQDNIHIIPSPVIENILQITAKQKPSLVVIDSIQTVYSAESMGEPGSVNQIRTSTHKILETHKAHNITTLLIGQITKDGSLAGPKMLEHLVDTVLYLEGSRDNAYRILRIPKNRFGPTDEICLFKMDPSGLKPIKNLNSEILDLDNQTVSPAGSVFTAVNDQNKVFILEIQALVSKTIFGYPQRKSAGLDNNRVQILTAVLNKYTAGKLQTYDIHLSAGSGEKTRDTSSDLAVAAAVLSSLANTALPQKTIFIGEIGLSGEIKPVKNLNAKLKEATKLGFSQAFIPQRQLKQSKQTFSGKLELKSIGKIQELEQFIRNSRQ